MNTLAIINTFGLLGVTSTTLGSVLGVLSLAAVAAVLTVKRLLYLCQPNEVLIFSGRRRVAGSSIARGYRIVRGGSTLRIPLLETADRMDLTNMILDVKVTNAYSKGGIPLTVQGIANIKIPGGEPLLSNTLERFLGSSKADIMKPARATRALSRARGPRAPSAPLNPTRGSLGAGMPVVDTRPPCEERGVRATTPRH